MKGKDKSGPAFWKVIAAGIVFAIISQVIHMIEAGIYMDYYIDPAYFGLWSKLMMPSAGAPPAEFFITGMIFGTIAGLLYSYVYLTIKGSIMDANPWMRGLKFGWLLFLVAGLPMFLTTYLIMAIPFQLNFGWLWSGLLSYLLGGAAIGRILK